MDFGLTTVQRELQERAREAIDRVVVPVVAEAAPGRTLSADQIKRIYKGLAPLGYLGSTIDPEVGGAGMSYVDYGLLLEAFGPSPIALNEVVPPRLIARVGTPEQKERWLGGLLSGDLLSTAGITEPQAGSDMRAFTCAAVPVDGGYRVTGKKRWIKYGGISDLITLFTIETDPDGKRHNTRLVLERDVSPWQSREIPCIGNRLISFVELELDDVFVPAENRIGAQGEAMAGFSRGIESSRPFIGLNAIGVAQHALDIAASYVKDRVAFGRPLAKFQAIQLALAEAATELAAGRLLCLQALWMMDEGQHCPREASMAKVFATEAAVKACNAAMDCMGAMGLAEEAGVERCWRDCRMMTVIDGTTGINKLIVGREMLGQSAFV